MTEDDHGRPDDADQASARLTRLTIHEAARLTGYTTEALRSRARRGKLPFIRDNVRGTSLFDRADLENLPPPTTDDDRGRPADHDGHPTADTPLTELTVDDLRSYLADLRSDLAEAMADRLAEHGRVERAEAKIELLQDRLEAEAWRLTGLTAQMAEVVKDRDQVRQEREDARVRAAGAEGEAKALREALAEARRPFWRRWLGT